MKRNRLMAIIAMCIMMLSISLSALAQDAIGIERGMTKDNVRKILGSPKVSSYITGGEIWQYLTNSSALSSSADSKKIIVEFDRDNKVVAYVVKPGTDRTLTFDREKLRDELSRVPRGYGNNRNNNYNNNRSFGYGYNNRNYGYGGNRYMSESDFSTIYDKVKNTAFASSKLDLLRVVSSGSRFSCDQCARLLGLFTFSSDKMNALKILASRIADPQNANAIYKQFTFSSDKDKAADIISSNYR